MGSRFRTRHLVVAFALLGCGCPPPAVPEPEADPDSAPPGLDQQTYAAADAAGQACMVLKSLGCPEADFDEPDCATSIRELVEIGTFDRRKLLCIRTSRTLVRIRTCDVDCAQ